MLNANYVATFLAVVRNASLRAAATERAVSPATASHHIKQLEEQTQTRLLTRAGRCEPTTAGKRFLPHARALLRVNDRAISAAQDTPLRLGAASNIGIYLLPLALERLRTHHPDAPTPELVIDTNPVIGERLSEGSLDIALVENPPESDVSAERWREEPLVVIVPPYHPWRHEPHVSAEQIARTRLLAGEIGTGTGALLREFLRHCASEPGIAAQLGSTEAVKRAVAHGHGVSLVLASAVEAEVSAGWLIAVPLEHPGIRKPLWAIWRRRHRPEGSDALMEALRPPDRPGQ